MLALLVGRLYFCFVIGLAGLAIGLAIARAELMGGKVVVGFSG